MTHRERTSTRGLAAIGDTPVLLERTTLSRPYRGISRLLHAPHGPMTTNIRPTTRDGAILHIEPPGSSDHRERTTRGRHAAIRDTPVCLRERPSRALIAASRACYTLHTTHDNQYPAHYARRAQFYAWMFLLSHQRRHADHGRSIEQKKCVYNYKYVSDAGPKRVSEWPSHQGCSGLLWAFPELKM